MLFPENDLIFVVIFSSVLIISYSILDVFLWEINTCVASALLFSFAYMFYR